MLECDLTPLELVDSQQLFQLRKDLNKWGKKLTLNSDNGPFAEYEHMVQKNLGGWKMTQWKDILLWNDVIPLIFLPLFVVFNQAWCFLYHVAVFCKGPIKATSLAKNVLKCLFYT